MTRQKTLKKFGINDIENPNGIAFLLSFNNDKKDNDLNERRFLSSDLSNESKIIDILGRTYIVLGRNDFDSIMQKITQIGKEVYDCDYNESAIIFNKIPD
ncbi:hypothetical protein ACQY1Q_10590 [Tenacibaculum sp. TC6]|uniref:hypothetical protein n=1 Tax=Tenacibaculum sp. TC6 TaxID=3423223 RepID=UPI003D35A1F3